MGRGKESKLWPSKREAGKLIMITDYLPTYSYVPQVLYSYGSSCLGGGPLIEQMIRCGHAVWWGLVGSSGVYSKPPTTYQSCHALCSLVV